jgi:hypothetical protein
MYADLHSFIARVRELLHYDAETGKFTWLVSRRYVVKAGDEAGCVKSAGYRYIQIDGKAYRSHRLAWLITHGCWPSLVIDHMNGNKDDNRIANLRDVTKQQNACNNNLQRQRTSSRFPGVSLRKKTGKWGAYLTRDNKTKALGVFDTEEEAHAAFIAARTLADQAIFSNGVAPIYGRQTNSFSTAGA